MNEQLKVVITAEINKLKTELGKGQKLLAGFKEAGAKAGKTVGVAFKAVASAIGKAVKIAAVGITTLVTAMVGVAEKTRDYRKQQAQLAASFRAAGSTAKQAKQTYSELYRVLGDTGNATEAASQLAKLTTDTKNLAEWTRICKGVYATFGNNIPIQSLTEAVNETAKTGEVTGALADALKRAGYNQDEFADQLFWTNSEAEREELIRRTLNGIYGEAADIYDETAESVLNANDAHQKLTDTLAVLGEAVEPLISIFKDQFANALTDLIPHFTLVTEGVLDMVKGIESGREKVTDGIKGLIDSIIDTITTAAPTVLNIGADLIFALLEGISSKLPDIISVITDFSVQFINKFGEIIPTVQKHVLGAIPDLIDAIFTIANEILKVLGSILPEMLENVVSIIPKIIESLMNNIPTLLQAAITFLMAIVDAIPVVIPELVKALPQIVYSVVNALLNSLPILIQGVIDLVVELVANLPQIIVAIIEAIPQIVQQIMLAVIDCLPQIIQALISLTTGIVTNLPRILVSLVDALLTFFMNLVSNIINTFVNLPENLGRVFGSAFEAIKTAFKGIGPHFSDIWNNIKQIFTNPAEFFKTKFSGAYNAAVNAFSSAKTGFAKVWSNMKAGFGNVSEWFRTTFSRAWQAVKNVFSKGGRVFDGIKEGILSGLKECINAIIRGINKVVAIPFNGLNSALGKLRDVNILGLEPFGWMPQISVPQIPELAKGGVLKKGQVGFLEGDGDEAVVPLEQNTEWIDKVANKLADVLGGSNRDIVLQVDGKTFARASINSINQLTRQTGKLALVVQ